MFRELSVLGPEDPDRNAEVCARHGVDVVLPLTVAGAALHQG